MYLGRAGLSIPTHNTHEITQALAYRGSLESLRICVAREHLKSIDESAKPELEATDGHYGHPRRRRVDRYQPVH